MTRRAATGRVVDTRNDLLEPASCFRVHPGFIDGRAGVDERSQTTTVRPPSLTVVDAGDVGLCVIRAGRLSDFGRWHA